MTIFRYTVHDSASNFTLEQWFDKYTDARDANIDDVKLHRGDDDMTIGAVDEHTLPQVGPDAIRRIVALISNSHFAIDLNF